MLTRADEIKRRLAIVNAAIKLEEKQLAEREARLQELRAFVDRLHARRVQFESELQREEAPRAQLTGPCVIEKAHDGVEWKV